MKGHKHTCVRRSHGQSSGMQNGYLTVYLSLSLALILSFILTFVEGARMSVIRMEAECVADIGMNSVLAEFHRELLEQYDLLFVDMSYGTASRRPENSAEHLRVYMKNNFTGQHTGGFSVRDWLALSVDKAVVKELSIASDEGGNVMKRQALEYMEQASVEGVLAKVAGLAGETEALELDTRDIDGERNSIQEQIDGIELPKKRDEDGNLVEIALNNPADKVNASRGGMVLHKVIGDVSKISRTAIYQEDYISHREKNTGIGIRPGLPAPSGITDDLLFDCYLFDKCGWYGNELDKSLLKYQMEYIIAGKDSDMENLETVVKRLVRWREVANVIYILSDSAKCMEAQIVALALSAVLLVPELAELVKYSILFAWAYVESLADVKCLMQGGRVPLMKTSADWKTRITNIINFSGNAPDIGDGGRGLNYEDYLRIMLFLEKSQIKNMRAMDIMEMDIRLTPGNTYFCMDSCFDSYLADISISSAFGYHCDIKKRYGYH